MHKPCLQIGSRQFACHRGLLALHSDYFQAMFTIGMVESGKAELNLDHVDADCMEMVLTFIYTGLLTGNVTLY